MEETKFTPGTWYAESESYPSLKDGNTWWRIYTTVDELMMVAEVGRSAEPTVEDIDTEKANAHLIAAAPDLYTASEKALSALRQYRHFFAQRGMDYPAGVDVEEHVIAALTKARGEG